MTTKKCSVCGEVKRIDEFQKNGKKPDGTGYYYKPQCKPCYREYQNEMKREKYLKDPEYRKDKQEKLNKWRSENNEHVRNHLNNYRRDRYNACAEYRDKILKSNNEFRQTDAGRLAHAVSTQRYLAKKRGLPNDLTIDDYRDCLEYFNNECCYCGSTEPLVREHVVPISNGGGTVRTNIVCACVSCNSSKSNKDMIEWYTGQPFYNAARMTRINNWIGGDANAKY